MLSLLLLLFVYALRHRSQILSIHRLLSPQASNPVDLLLMVIVWIRPPSTPSTTLKTPAENDSAKRTGHLRDSLACIKEAKHETQEIGHHYICRNGMNLSVHTFISWRKAMFVIAETSNGELVPSVVNSLGVIHLILATRLVCWWRDKPPSNSA